jgi:ATP-dependent Zn protease
MSGADLENLINLAALQSVRQGRINKENNPVMTGDEYLSFVKCFMGHKKKQ